MTVSAEDTYELIASLLYPLWDATRTYIGVLGIDIQISEVARLFAQQMMENASDGVCFLTTPDGRVVASSVGERISDDQETLRFAWDYDNDLIASVAKHIRDSAENSSVPFLLEVPQYLTCDGRSDGQAVTAHSYMLPVRGDAEVGLELTLVVSYPEESFTRHLHHDAHVTLAISLALLCAAGFVLGGAVLGMSQCLALIAVRTARVAQGELENALCMDSGLQRVLNVLQELRPGADSRTKAGLDMATRVLISSVNSGKLFAPSLNTRNLDVHTQQWLQTEFGSAIDNLSDSSYYPHTEAEPPLSALTPTAVPIVIRSESFDLCALAAAVASLGFASWSAFPIFALCERLHVRQPLAACGAVAFEQLRRAPEGQQNQLHRDFGDVFALQGESLAAFLEAANAAYHDVPYHSALHASDVLQAAFVLMNSAVGAFLTPIERLALTMAAIIHDADHPGTNNNFQVAVGSELALLYNDTSVLENHHLCVGFSLLEQCGVLRGLTPVHKKTLRKLLIAVVLATDMSSHFQILTEFKTICAHGKIDLGNQEHRILVLKMIMKMCDISNVARPLGTMKQWTSRLTEEFFAQGDQERELGMPVASFMDRAAATDLNIAQTQVNFIRFVAMPLFEAFDQWAPIPELLANIDENRDFWCGRVITLGGTADMVKAVKS
eukprot:TRINITY_DN2319_c0_g1_i1.p1 TRINITY_DN2319_c0_g1~~TRINITY_DN2319_c0_g1_i1.p1  ORF type:complete len:667 (+),score=131.69 TRINITY_DN2319_c0_g1_i1:1061-3061(+)